MTDSQNKPVLTFDDKTYELDTLSDEIKGLVGGLQLAESQIRLQEDNLKILSVGRQALAEQLKQELLTVTPLTEDN